MADDEKGVENTSASGNDWELVSLTASTYAAAPGPMAFDPSIESKDRINKEVHVDSTAMFMSNQYIFPPFGHKHLMIEPDCSEIPYELAPQDANRAEELSEAIMSDDDNWKLKSADDLPDHSMDFGGGNVFEELTMARKELDIFVDPTFSSFHAKSVKSQSVICGEEFDPAEPNLPYHDPDYPSDATNAAKLNEVSKVDGPGMPCEAWWKKHAMTVYNRVKETNPFLSVFVAAAVMGFVILGQQWQREKLQLQQLRWFTVGEESLRRMLGPFSRFKDILVGGHQQTLLIRGGVVSTH